MSLNRRIMLAGGLTALTSAAWAQHEHHSGQFERLNQPGRIGLPDLHQQHAVKDSPAPAATQQGQWRARAPLPIPRTESLKDTIARVLPYWEERIAPALRQGSGC